MLTERSTARYKPITEVKYRLEGEMGMVSTYDTEQRER